MQPVRPGRQSPGGVAKKDWPEKPLANDDDTLPSIPVNISTSSAAPSAAAAATSAVIVASPAIELLVVSALLQAAAATNRPAT